MENIKILFGKKLKELRKKNNLTQARLAELVNVDDKHISCIESGKNFPSADLLVRLCDAFKIEAKDFFEFYHLQEPNDLRKSINSMVKTLDKQELVLAHKYIRTFLLK